MSGFVPWDGSAASPLTGREVLELLPRSTGTRAAPTAKQIFSNVVAAKANLTLPRFCPLSSTHKLFAFHGLPGQSSEKHRHKTWQPRVERALLCSTALNSLGNTTQLPGIGTALFSCQK